jgi:hypothetical protein
VLSSSVGKLVSAIFPIIITGFMDLGQSSESQQFWGLYIIVGARGSAVVKALCYKSECHGFETR